MIALDPHCLIQLLIFQSIESELHSFQDSWLLEYFHIDHQ